MADLIYKKVAIALLDGLPTVDSVTVIRCKDCKRRYDSSECPMCFLVEDYIEEYTFDNGYCDRGERKTDA